MTSNQSSQSSEESQFDMIDRCITTIEQYDLENGWESIGMSIINLEGNDSLVLYGPNFKYSSTQLLSQDCAQTRTVALTELFSTPLAIIELTDCPAFDGITQPADNFLDLTVTVDTSKISTAPLSVYLLTSASSNDGNIEDIMSQVITQSASSFVVRISNPSENTYVAGENLVLFIEAKNTNV